MYDAAKVHKQSLSRDLWWIQSHEVKFPLQVFPIEKRGAAAQGDTEPPERLEGNYEEGRSIGK